MGLNEIAFALGTANRFCLGEPEASVWCLKEWSVSSPGKLYGNLDIQLEITKVYKRAMQVCPATKITNS